MYSPEIQEVFWFLRYLLFKLIIKKELCGFFFQTQCSDFKAGDTLRSRSRYHALDETAVFGAVCRHDFPIRMLNLKHGERWVPYEIYAFHDKINVNINFI